MKRKEQLKEYNGLSLPSLLKKEVNLKRKIFDLRMDLARGKVKNTAQIRLLRRELARVKSIIFKKVAKEISEEEVSKNKKLNN